MNNTGTSDWSNSFAWKILPDLLKGLWVTVQITLGGIVIALVLGLVVAVFRRTRIPVLAQLLDFYVLFIRGTPLLIQVFAAYYIAPDYGILIEAKTTAIIVIGVNYSAYLAEVYRAGINDVAAGQWEAATALSLPMSVTWRRVILPQAVRSTIPALGNYLVQMFKDSAIVAYIGVLELLGTGQEIVSDTFRPNEPYTLVALLFLAVSVPSAALVRLLERRLAYSR